MLNRRLYLIQDSPGSLHLYSRVLRHTLSHNIGRHHNPPRPQRGEPDQSLVAVNILRRLVVQCYSLYHHHQDQQLHPSSLSTPHLTAESSSWPVMILRGMSCCCCCCWLRVYRWFSRCLSDRSNPPPEQVFFYQSPGRGYRLQPSARF